MIETADLSLAQAIEALSCPGILIGHRLISPEDELALFEDEARTIASRAAGARRASGAARIVGRQLLGRLGYAECAVPKGPSGAPIWPAGLIGSFAHDDRIAVAAIGRSRDVGALGIDVEPAQALPPELLEMVATPLERQKLGDDPREGRLLFAAKEAVYKAVYPLDRVFLDYHDIEVDLAGGKAIVRNGRAVDLRCCISTHVVVLAFTSDPARVR
jgi:4'-phosphopantetheinyl transferase EntD